MQRFREEFPDERKVETVVKQLAAGIFALRDALGSGDASVAQQSARQVQDKVQLARRFLQAMPFAVDQAAARGADALPIG